MPGAPPARLPCDIRVIPQNPRRVSGGLEFYAGAARHRRLGQVPRFGHPGNTFFMKINRFLPITYPNPISDSTPSPCYISNRQGNSMSHSQDSVSEEQLAANSSNAARPAVRLRPRKALSPCGQNYQTNPFSSPNPNKQNYLHPFKTNPSPEPLLPVSPAAPEPIPRTAAPRVARRSPCRPPAPAPDPQPPTPDPRPPPPSPRPRIPSPRPRPPIPSPRGTMARGDVVE